MLGDTGADGGDGPALIGALVSAATLCLADIEVGQEASFHKNINVDDVDAFAKLSGDFSPLHMDDAFARLKGFERRVVHGAYLTGLASQIVGMHLPGQNCLLQTLQMKFVAPTYVGSLVTVVGVVDQVSIAGRAAVIQIKISNSVTGTVLATGKVNIGFTENHTP
jgi:3-hydroxybutyryl-CoA dehydratase